MTFLQIGLLRPSVQLIPSPPKSRGTFADRCRASGLEALPTIGAGIPRQAEPFHGLSECVHTRVACYPRFRYAGSGWFPTVFPQGNGRVLVVHFRFSFLSFAPGTRRVHDHVPTGKPMRDWTKTDAETTWPGPCSIQEAGTERPVVRRIFFHGNVSENTRARMAWDD